MIWIPELSFPVHGTLKGPVLQKSTVTLHQDPDTFSLAVAENFQGKSKGEFVYSFSESVHPIVPQKKSP